MDNQNLMVEAVQQRRDLLVKALALSAKRGGFKLDLTGTVARLVSWARSDNQTFEGWNSLIVEADSMYEQWYDWYKRTYTKSHDDLGGKTIEQWYQSLFGDDSEAA